MVIKIETINLYSGLLILVIINIVMGSVNALFKRKFDYKRLLQGITKGLVITVCFCGTYVVGILNPDIIAFKINDTDVDLLTAFDIIVLTSYYHYAKQVIEKLMFILNENLHIENEEDT